MRLGLHVMPLPAKSVMNRHEYAKIIEGEFASWAKGIRNPVLVQDHEGCLWRQEPQEALNSSPELRVAASRENPQVKRTTLYITKRNRRF